MIYIFLTGQVLWLGTRYSGTVGQFIKKHFLSTDNAENISIDVAKVTNQKLLKHIYLGVEAKRLSHEALFNGLMRKII